jgi:hypothetical protein
MNTVEAARVLFSLCKRESICCYIFKLIRTRKIDFKLWAKTVEWTDEYSVEHRRLSFINLISERETGIRSILL